MQFALSFPTTVAFLSYLPFPLEAEEERRKMADKLGSIQMKLIVLFLIVFLLLSSSIPKLGYAAGEDETNTEKHEEKGGGSQEPDVVERAMGVATLKSRWDVIKSWFHLAILKSPLHRPDMRKEERSAVVTAAGEAMKEAASKSYEASKHSAEATAKLAGDVLQITTDKLKKRMSSGEGRDGHDEL